MNDWITSTPDRPSRNKAIWPAALVGLVMALGVVAVWQVISHRAHEHVDAAVDFAAQINESLIVHDIDHRLSALDRLARRTRTGGEEQRRAWEADATRYIRDMPGFEAIVWADSSLQTRWLVSLDEYEDLASLDVARWGSSKSAIAIARESGGVTLSEPFELASGELCVAVFLPILEGERVDGVVAAVLNLQVWLTATISDIQGSDNHVRILLEGREVFRHVGDGGSIDESQTHRHEFETHGLTWTTLITPTTSFLSAGHGDSSALVLIVGLLFSALAVVVVYLALEAREKSRQFQDIATRLATLFRNLPGVAYRGRNAPGRPMEFISAGCRALSGYSRKELDESHLSWDDLICPEDRKRVELEMGQAIESDQAYELEYRITTREGEDRWMWERGRAVDPDSDGDTYIEGFISDISEQRAAENEARQYRENLAHVDRLNMLGEMATGIAHEINQPLTAISLFVQAGGRLLDAKKLDRMPEIFEKLNQHAHRASAVIERMQSMARRRESAKELIDCNVLVGDVAKLAEAEARFRDMTIEVETASELPSVSVDAVQIQQVALNLLRNAMEAMQSIDRRDGNVIRLQTRLDSDGNIEVSVIDQGNGVSGDIAETIFAPFSTTKKSGMGMGLSISRAIIIAHGGRLDFRNNEACGATFFFTLPPADPED
jgi:two-component system sensor kinase FixL